MSEEIKKAILEELNQENLKKVCIREWMQICYGKKSMSIKTIQKKCLRGEIPNAIKEGKKWFILMSAKEYEQRKK